MKTAHWSQIFLNFVTIEVTFVDDSRQTWHYDCSQFATVQDAEANMAADFNLKTPEWADSMLYITHNDENFTIDMGIPDFDTGQEFASNVFETIGETLGWQPLVIS